MSRAALEISMNWRIDRKLGNVCTSLIIGLVEGCFRILAWKDETEIHKNLSGQNRWVVRIKVHRIRFDIEQTLHTPERYSVLLSNFPRLDRPSVNKHTAKQACNFCHKHKYTLSPDCHQHVRRYFDGAEQEHAASFECIDLSA